MRTKKTKTLCIGCTENFYNGNNDLGVTECWNYKSGTIRRKKFVPVWMRPPWTDVPVITTLSCHRKKGYVSVAPNQTK